MTETFRLSLSGARLDLRLPPASLDPSFARFKLHPSDPSTNGAVFTVAVEEDLSPPPAASALTGCPLTLLDGNPGVIAFDSPVFRGRLDLPGRRGAFHQTPGSRAYRAGLQILLSHLLESRSRILVHGAGLVDGETAWLFAGPSGAGKSTVAELAGRPLLNDELCCVGIDGESTPTLSGTPFGRCDLTGTFPLAGICWLEKSATDECEALPPAQALRLLLSQTVAGAGDPDHLSRLFRHTADLVRRSPVYRLRFTRSRQFMDVMDATRKSL
ncbi:MAG: hypothetical protein KA419_13370 [Acidobacteria bacterium]|nr:hypothetical protein [Acidobacteriota bacterium]